MANSFGFQPQTMLRPARPFGDVVDGRERLRRIDRMHERHVHGREDRDAAGQRGEPGAQVNVSNDHSRAFVSPPKPAQRAIGRKKSKPPSSAIFAAATLSGQVAFQRSGHGGERQPAVGVGREDAELEAARDRGADVSLHHRVILGRRESADPRTQFSRRCCLGPRLSLRSAEDDIARLGHSSRCNYSREHASEPRDLIQRVVVDERDAQAAGVHRKAEPLHQPRRVHVAVADADAGRDPSRRRCPAACGRGC